MNKRREYKYVFTNGDVDELQIYSEDKQCELCNEHLNAWIDVLAELDRIEYNNNHKETRRHCSLEAYNQDDTLVPADNDGFREFYEQEIWEEMSVELTDREKVIGDLYFRQGYKQQEIAKIFKVKRSRITQIITRIRKKLKKFL